MDAKHLKDFVYKISDDKDLVCKYKKILNPFPTICSRYVLSNTSNEFKKIETFCKRFILNKKVKVDPNY